MLAQTLYIAPLAQLRAESHKLLFKDQLLSYRIEQYFPVGLPDHLESKGILLPLKIKITRPIINLVGSGCWPRGHVVRDDMCFVLCICDSYP